MIVPNYEGVDLVSTLIVKTHDLLYMFLRNGVIYNPFAPFVPFAVEKNREPAYRKYGEVHCVREVATR